MKYDILQRGMSKEILGIYDVEIRKRRIVYLKDSFIN